MKDGMTPAPVAGHGRLREAAWTLCAAGMVLLFAAALFVAVPGSFWADDYQSQHLPARCDIARAWRSGEVPLLTPYSWFCGALAAEYQYAVFSAFEALCVTAAFGLELSLPATAAVLVFIQLAVLSTGAFRLARHRGLGPDLALLVTLIASLNGYLMVWCARSWLPGLASFAWLPWYWRPGPHVSRRRGSSST